MKYQGGENKIMYEEEIKLKIRELSEDLRREVLDYIEFLLRKYKSVEIKAGKFKFDWEGGLSEIRDKFSSVELQHKAWLNIMDYNGQGF